MATRDAYIKITNQSPYGITGLAISTVHGKRSDDDTHSSSLKPNDSTEFHSESDGFMTGTEGTITGNAIDGTFNTQGSFSVHYYDPFSGVNHFDVTSSGGINIACAGNSDDQPYKLDCTISRSTELETEVVTVEDQITV